MKGLVLKKFEFDKGSSRGDEWSIKIFNCSQNFYLCSICSQNLNGCSLARAPKMFAVAGNLAF